MSETPDELRAQAEDLRDHFTGDHCNCMSAEEAADVIDALLARLATTEAKVRSSWRMHANACERHIALGIRIMTAFAENRPLIEVLDLIGDDLNEVDAVDDESIALYERAKAAVARREQP